MMGKGTCIWMYSSRGRGRPGTPGLGCGFGAPPGLGGGVAGFRTGVAKYARFFGTRVRQDTTGHNSSKCSTFVVRDDQREPEAEAFCSTVRLQGGGCTLARPTRGSHAQAGSAPSLSWSLLPCTVCAHKAGPHSRSPLFPSSHAQRGTRSLVPSCPRFSPFPPKAAARRLGGPLPPRALWLMPQSFSGCQMPSAG